MKIVGSIIYTLFVALLLGVAGLFLASLIPIPGNIEIKIVKSGSMEPAIHTGSVVIVKPATAYAAGDIITFGEDTNAQIPTTHRVLSMQGAGASTLYQTKGDANEEQDPQMVAASDVIGKVLVTVPYAGYILDFARQPWGFAFLIGVPAALIIFDEVLNIIQEIAILRRKRRRAHMLEPREL